MRRDRIPTSRSRNFRLGMLSKDGDRYIITDGPAKGMRGYFQRDAARTVNGVHLGGRLATRVASLVS